MKLKQLLKDLKDVVVKGSKEIEITGISAHSKTVAPGNLFIAKRGFASDGHDYIREAIQAGCIAILSDIFDPSLKDVTQVIYPNVVEAEGFIANHFFGSPSEELFMVGVTGTSGKTTTTYLIKHVLEEAKIHSGLIGTIEYIVGQNRYPATRTTPDVIANHKMLREMVRSHCTAAAMEVTSHATSQKRVAHIEYDVAVFTNLTHEHLDYHKTMEDYFLAKKELFTSLRSHPESKKKNLPKYAVVNSDSPWSQKIISDCPALVITYGIDSQADIQASNISFSEKGTTFQVNYKGQKQECTFHLLGRFNVLNALAAIAVALAKGISLSGALKSLESFQSAPGRLERVSNELALNIYIDYAHKVDALKNVLQSLRECTKAKIITVFGCGGDRDREKRPFMAKVSEDLSDITIVTSDNPRSEDPLQIIKEIKSGFLHPEKHIIESDRKAAIHKAIDLATPEDIVLIAGKGHEKKQYFQHQVIDFDDYLVAKEYCTQKSEKVEFV
jgi:UDP-N-acetylmuramoyl-L-alanyl-D-glutamate--2,6-diaminopimelate ligase